LSQQGPDVASDVVFGALSLISAVVIRATGTPVPGPTGRSCAAGGGIGQDKERT